MSNNTTCTLWHNRPTRCDILVAVQKICPSLSIVGCCFVMLIIWLFKKYHVFVQRLIFALAFSAMFQSISYLLGNVHSKSSHLVCHIQGFMMQYFIWSTLSWVIVITVNMVFIVKGIDSKRFELRYHAFVWLNALLWACLPFIKNNYGPAGVWCWVVKDATLLRFGIWYFPLFIICICMSCTYVYLFIHNRRLSKSACGTELEQVFKTFKKEVKPLLVYPLIYLILTIPIFVYRLYDAIHPDEEPLFGLLLAAVMFGPSVGSCNALAYAFYNETIREITWDKFKQAIYTKVIGKSYHVRPYDVDSVGGSIYSRKSRRATSEATSELEFHNVTYDERKDFIKPVDIES